MPKQDEDEARLRGAPGWPGPVGWWYLPLIWLVVLAAAVLAWSFT